MQIIPSTKDNKMHNRSIAPHTVAINNHSSVVGKLTTRASNPKHSYLKRPHLPIREFKQANQQKVMWLKAAYQECNLRGNEILVLEALAFLTDPVYGVGTPHIGAIQEKVRERNPGIHYQTILECLKRLEQKGAIIKQRRGKKLTNLYTLVGFEYKPDSCYRDSRHSSNSSLSPKREREKKSYKIGNNSPSAWPDGRRGEPEREEILEDTPITDEQRELAKEKIAQMRKAIGL